jgi:serine/threonine-protein kinase
MERLRGESLGARLKRGRMSVAETLDVIIGACRGVAEAHGEGVIHRDLKPDNIFLCVGKDGSARDPKVVDFGIGKLLEGESAGPVTKTGFALGTPSYMSPEQLNSPKSIDARADVYSMGVVLYVCLTGERPYRAKGVYELIQRICEGNPRPIHELAPEVTPELEAIVRRAMSIERESRYSSMSELANELAAVRDGVASHAAALPTTQPVFATRASPLYTPPLYTPPLYPPTPFPTHVPTHAQPISQPYAPSGSGWQTGPRVAPTAPDRSRIVLGVLVLVIALVVVGSLGIGIVFVARDRPRTSTATAPTATSGGMRPSIDLTLRGDCENDVRFDGSLGVLAASNYLSIMALPSRGALTFSVNQEHHYPATIEQSTPAYYANLICVILIGGSRHQWRNIRAGTDTSGVDDPIHGRIVFHRFERQQGLIDATFEHVTLQDPERQTICEVNGRVVTYGLTMGE